MNKKKIIAFLIVTVLLFSQVLTACGDKKKYYDNEEDALVLSTSDLDGVFNPFFATSGADMGVVGMTQLNIFSADKEGKITYGANYDCIALDYTMEVYDNNKLNDEDYANYFSTYNILLKNNVKFSDGSLMTSKDVLFNFYVYLDPVYTGSTTMYSTKIQGLTEYRNQTYDPAEYEQAEINFPIKGRERVTNLINWASNTNSTLADLTEEMEADIEVIKELYLEELHSDWNAAAGTLADFEKDYPEINNTWRAFMVMQGYIELINDKNLGKYIEWGVPKDFCDGLSEEEAKIRCIETIYKADIVNADLDTFKNSIYYILLARSTGVYAEEYFTANEKSKYFELVRENNDGELVVKSISGITVNDNVRSFNNKTYTSDHSLLTIKINGVDPKAIYNFSIPIVPMKYYGGEYADLANGSTHFGVNFGDIDFMFKTVRAQEVPIGAGAYMASNASSSTGSVTKNQFFTNNIVYFVRNEHFLLGKPKIKKIRYKVITKAQLLDSASLGEVHFVDPDAKKSNIDKVDADPNLAYENVKLLGYGYIGINAKYVPDIRVRKAIMHAMNTALAMEYYTNDMAFNIYRPMSEVSWAYPRHIKTPYYAFDESGETSWNLLKDSYWLEGGVLRDNYGNTLKYTFTIAGDSDDHPMYATMSKAADILNKLGFDITVTKDPNALRKLASGLLTVWAAAWGSTIDPDMYQVYHMDSTATSVLNWGYKEILSGNNKGYNTNASGEISLIENLSELIDNGRKYLLPEDRVGFYHEALDVVMELAIELPTYQRNNMFVYNKSVIDETTLIPSNELSPYNGPLSRIWEVSLVTKK